MPFGPEWADGLADFIERSARAGDWMQDWMTARPFAYQGRGDRQAPPQAETEEVVAFSDASRPGTIDVRLFGGSITVKGSARRDVRVRMTYRGQVPASVRKQEPPPPGMRRLTPSRRSALSIEEQNNEITIRSGSMMQQADVELEVPARTNLELRVMLGGAIDVEGVDGDIEVNNLNGPIRLTGVAGSAVADAVNGQVFVTMTRVTADKVMAFSSLNGNVDVTLPRATKASLELRSRNGDVFTDFDVQETGPPPPSAAAPRARADARAGSGSGRGSGTATGPVGRGSRDTERQRRGGNSNRNSNDSANSNTIYGTINGGGPKVEVRSFNGNVYIRRGQ
jgi:hypothetical protein